MTYVASLAQLRLPLYFVITAVTYVSTQLYGDTESGHCLVGAGVTKLPFLFHPLEREREGKYLILGFVSAAKTLTYHTLCF